MPSIIDQIREQQAWEQPKKSGNSGFIIGTIAAFGAGILLAMSFGALPGLSLKGLTASRQMAIIVPAAPGKPAGISIPTGGRLGDAAESKLLRTCIPAALIDLDPDSKIQSKDIYRILQAGSHVARVASIAQIKQKAVDQSGLASMWAEVADCVFKQNGWALCDPDNRALAVEAVGSLTRLANAALAAKPDAKGPNGAPRTFAQVRAELDGRRAVSPQQQAQAASAVKDRVYATLKVRAQEGRIIASDFGYLAPAEVLQAIKDIKPAGDACASRS